MRQRNLAAFVALWIVGCSGQDAAPATDGTSSPPVVVFETSLGTIVAELAPEHAPQTVRHFLTHVRSQFYDGVVVHRVEPGFVIQAGGYQPDMRERRTSAFPVANENPTGLLNARGTLAMARTADPHSGLIDFFINLADNAKLDYRDSTADGWGYVVFGRVIEGMDVVDVIAGTPTRPQGRLRSLPIEPIIISHAYIRE